MKTLSSLFQVLIVGAIAAYAGADFVLSGTKFTWPPPPQLKPAALFTSAETELAKLTGRHASEKSSTASPAGG